MSLTHAPTPWKRMEKTGVNRWRIVDASGEQVADVNRNSFSAELNAELIVKAGAHQLLIDALEAARMAIETSEDQEPQMIAALSQIEAALAAAGEPV